MVLNNKTIYLYTLISLHIQMESVLVKKQAIVDLIKTKEQFDAIVESIELMTDKSFMESYKKSKEQIKKREFASWDDL